MTTPKIWVLLAIFSTTSCGCFGYRTREFVIPNDFSGPFFIVVDPQGEPLRWWRRRATIHVPPCGLVRIRSDKVLRDMAENLVRRENGEQVPTEFYASANEVALYFGMTRSSNNSNKRKEYFVGTKAEFEAFPFESFPTPSCNE